MRLIHHHRFLLALAVAYFGATSGSALTIDLDFIDNSLFNTNATARAAIEQAADDISDAITTALSPVNDYQWQRANTSGGQTLTGTYNWNYRYTVGESSVNIPIENVPAHTIKVLVRGENLTGSTLGQGGPAGYRLAPTYNINYSGSVNTSTLQTQFNTLTTQLTNLLDGEMDRGAGPIISSVSDTAILDFPGLPGSPDATAPYSLSYGPGYGTLALDTSYSGTFGNYWHLNHSTPVASGKRDLYSVALHEILHAIGVGASETWSSLANGTTWTGAEVIAEAGSGAGMVVGGHVAHGKTGRNIYTGATQEAVMDPNLTIGTRKYLTTLDLAFLRDIGYTTITPEFGIPGDFNDDGLVNMSDYVVWRNNLGASTEAAINYNGNGGGITAADFTYWKNRFGNTSGALSGVSSPAVVPEPSSLVLAVLSLSGLWARLRQGKA